MPWPKKTFPHTEARYDSDCAGCGLLISEGDEIYLVDDEWVCEPCKDDAE